MPQDLGYIQMGCWTWNEIPPKHREDTLYMPVQPCTNTDVHERHIFSDEDTEAVVFVCGGVRRPEPTRYILCQFMYPQIQDHLPCKMREGDGVTGYQCERLDYHTDGHFFSEHLIRHAKAGNGYSCGDIEIAE